LRHRFGFLHTYLDNGGSSVSIVTRLRGWSTRLRVPAGPGIFCLRYSVQTACGATPASCLMFTGGSFPQPNATEA